MFKPYKIQWDDEKVTRLWDYYSTNKSAQDLYFTKLVGDKVLAYANSRIGLKGKRILDYGSGPGYLFHHLLKAKYQVKYNALDNSKESIDRLNMLYSSSPIFEEAYLVDKFPSGLNEKFDLIICCEVIEHLTDDHLSSMIVEFKQLMKPGGYLLLTTPNNENMDASMMICPDCGCTFHRWQHQRSWTKESLGLFMEKNGIKTKSVIATNLYHKNMLQSLKNLTLSFLGKLGYDYRPINLIYLGQIV